MADHRTRDSALPITRVLAHRAGRTTLIFSVVFALCAVALIVSNQSAGSSSSAQIQLSKPGAVQTLKFSLAAQAAPVGPPSLPTGTTAKSALTGAKAELQTHLPTPGNGISASSVQTAINYLTAALSNALWVDGNRVDPTNGGTAFDNAVNAATTLDAIKKNPPPWVTIDVDTILSAIRLVTLLKIADNTCLPQKQNQLDNANKELSTADTDFDKRSINASGNGYENAWKHAPLALGQICPINVDPTALFNATNMVPLDVINNTATVKVVGAAASSVTLAETNVTHGGPVGSGNLANKLQLKIEDTTSGASTVYNGALDSMSTQTLAGAGSGGSWNANEIRTYKFTVTFPASGNEYQATNAAVTFVWTRT